MGPKPRKNTKTNTRVKTAKVLSDDEPSNSPASPSQSNNSGKRNTTSRSQRTKNALVAKSESIEKWAPSVRKVKSSPIRSIKREGDAIPGVVLRFEWVNGNLEGNCVRIVQPHNSMSSDTFVTNIGIPGTSEHSDSLSQYKKKSKIENQSGSSELVTLAGMMAAKVAKLVSESLVV